MANAEHLEILKSGVKEWNKWRDENENIRPQLSHASLNDANLSLANLSEANLSNANLYGADLSGSDLHGANLKDANLAKVDFSPALVFNTYLQGGDMIRTNLADADLSYAELFGANMYEVNLSGADLSYADLTQAYLVHVNFFNTDLFKSSLDSTVFGQTNLGTCKNLETVNIGAPCNIDFQTLSASKNLPKTFLLKIGLPELFIDALPDFYQNKGIQLYSVFLSHSWANKNFAHKLYEDLIGKGVNVFIDEKKMKPGDNIFDAISRGIQYYDKTILVCSKDSLESWWVDQELELVTEKERNLQKETGKKTGLLIPITIDDHIYNWEGGKRMAIRNRVIGDFRNWQDDDAFENALSDLIHALNVDRPDIKPPSYLKKI